MRRQIVHLMGRPAAGKSTLARDLVAALPGAVWIDLDEYLLRMRWGHAHDVLDSWRVITLLKAIDRDMAGSRLIVFESFTSIEPLGHLFRGAYVLRVLVTCDPDVLRQRWGGRIAAESWPVPNYRRDEWAGPEPDMTWDTTRSPDNARVIELVAADLAVAA